MPLFRGLTNSKENVEVVVIHWDKSINTPYVPESIPNVFYHKRSQFKNSTHLFNFIFNINPKIIYISGWMDKMYIYTLFKIKLNNKLYVKTIAGIDDIWYGTLKQNFASYFATFILKYLFDYLWISGMPQYYYAKKMKFPDSRILLHLLSTNTNIEPAKKIFKKRFLYIGRFHQNKGLEILLNAYIQLPVNIKKEWPLELYGNGPLLNSLNLIKDKYVHINNYLIKEDLQQEYNKGGIFVLPSIYEAWGVVVHEAITNGLPIILSYKVGSNLDFLINNFNGFKFYTEDELHLIFLKITNMSLKDLNEMSNNSLLLSKRITTEMSISSLLSIL
jgi:glycosyltransferase involved in cell wall biosynthesis